MRVLFIFYVNDQDKSTAFYSKVLGLPPSLHVPGMTEYTLSDGSFLGLMPASGIKRLLGDTLPDPTNADGIPRAELYLLVENAALYHQRAVEGGAKEISGMSERPWGDRVAYSLDPDGHVLAFAERLDAVI